MKKLRITRPPERRITLLQQRPAFMRHSHLSCPADRLYSPPPFPPFTTIFIFHVCSLLCHSLFRSLLLPSSALFYSLLLCSTLFYSLLRLFMQDHCASYITHAQQVVVVLLVMVVVVCVYVYIWMCVCVCVCVYVCV